MTGLAGTNAMQVFHTCMLANTDMGWRMSLANNKSASYEIKKYEM
jgi:hypothetical protein